MDSNKAAYSKCSLTKIVIGFLVKLGSFIKKGLSEVNCVRSINLLLNEPSSLGSKKSSLGVVPKSNEIFASSVSNG